MHVKSDSRKEAERASRRGKRKNEDTALPGDKCWQEFMTYLEAPVDMDGKAGRLVCKLDRDLADSLDDCDIRGRCRSDLVNAIVRSFFENHLFQLAQYRREKKSLFNNYTPESHA